MNIHRVTPRPREKSGRGQRESQARQEARMRAAVLAQPHRRGDTRQGRRWPIGRLILDGVVKAKGVEPGALERAAERYAELYGHLRWTMDSRRPFQAGGRAERPPPTPEERARIERDWGDAQRVLRDCPQGHIVVRAMAYGILDAAPDFDERSFSFVVPYGCGLGLAGLVRHWRME